MVAVGAAFLVACEASPVAIVVATAAITTGAVTAYVAATDSTMVVDMSGAAPLLPCSYGKIGGSMVVDFENDNVNLYGHAGGGLGYSLGPSFSVGLVDNYEKPSDYEKHFLDLNAGYLAGLDHCWNPLLKYDSAPKATAVTFSSGVSGGFGYDYYFEAMQILTW